MNKKNDILLNMFETLQDQVRFADSKATAIITFKLIMLAFLRTQVQDLNDAYKVADTATIILFSVFIITFMTSTVYILRVIIPRLTSGEGSQSSVFFFEIAHMEPEEYIEFIRKQSEDELSSDIAKQIHTLSQIAVVKYHNIHKSVMFFGAANICYWCAILRASLI